MRVVLCCLGIVSSVLYMFWWFKRQTYKPGESIEEVSMQFALFMHLGLIVAILVLSASVAFISSPTKKFN